MSLERNMQTIRQRQWVEPIYTPNLPILGHYHGPNAWPTPCVVNVNGAEVLAGSLSHHRLLAAQ